VVCYDIVISTTFSEYFCEYDTNEEDTKPYSALIMFVFLQVPSDHFCTDVLIL